MFTVNFYASFFVSRGNSIGEKLIRLDWEKPVYRSLFTLASTLLFHETIIYYDSVIIFCIFYVSFKFLDGDFQS